MSIIDLNDFMKFCKEQEGKRLPTIGGRSSFKLSLVKNGCLHYSVGSSGKHRQVDGQYIPILLTRYANIESLRPKDYKDITWSGSYTLRLVQLFMNR